jgi:hypothetical protein
MKKFLLATTSILFLAGCGTISLSSLPDKPLEPGNDGRVQQYLEENLIPDSENAICNFEQLNQPNGNVVEVWALCEEFMLNENGKLNKGAAMSLPVKITFANPTLYVIPEDGERYVPSLEENFSDVAVEKILAQDVYDVSALAEKNMERATKWLLTPAVPEE